MATTTEYSIENDLTSFVKEMIGAPEHAEFKAIRDQEILILPAFIVRTNKDGETQPCSGMPVKVEKVKPLHRLYMKDKPHYLMTVDYHTWDQAPDTVRSALVHHALMGINVSRADDGQIKLSSRKPDVVTFTATIRRFGAWNEMLQDIRRAFKQNTDKLLPINPRAKYAESEEVEPSEEEPTAVNKR